ncbi:hypothetical protein [Tepidimonas taiwanensis]|uniref:hypothetical protein n=1 Tax=Tepidimonas taiwanensis TaxID=307486 RepID=UPI0012E07F71|nr:hypothetical protein [Tepidimonas taiwanensis]
METLIVRIEQGKTTMEDAYFVVRVMERLFCYELALREIVRGRRGEDARIAYKALFGVEAEEWTPDGAR